MIDLQNVREEQHTSYASVSRVCIVALYIMFALWGVIQLTMPENSVLYFATAFLSSLFATGWTIYDAKQHRIRIVPVLQMLHFFLWPIGAPIYLLYRSGMQGIFVAVVHGIGLMATLAAAFYLTFYILHFAGLLDARFYQ